MTRFMRVIHVFLQAGPRRGWPGQAGPWRWRKGASGPPGLLRRASPSPQWRRWHRILDLSDSYRGMYVLYII